MGFTYYRTLTVDHTQCGTADSTNFPVLVYISDSTLKDVSHGGHVQSSTGADILFFSDSGAATQIASEIDYYDNVNGIVWAWVQVGTLSHSTNSVFYVFYDNASPPSRTTNPWDSNFVGVYHFGNGSSLSLSDSTTNGNNLTGSGTPTAGAGQIAGAMALASASSQEAKASSLTLPLTAITHSAWVKNTSFPNAYNTLLTLHTHTTGTVFADLHIKSTGKLALYLTATGTIDYDGTGSNTLATGTWYHLALVYDSVQGLVGYVNGQVDKSVAAAGNLLTGALSDIEVGNDSPFSPRYINGVVDEARISSVGRSASWILSEYNNGANPDSFVAIGSETATSVPATVSPPVATITIAALVPTVEGDLAVKPPVATIAIAAPVPAITAAATVSPPVAAITIAGPIPAVTGAQVAVVSPPAAAVAVAGLLPTITGAASVTVSPPVAQVAIAAPVPIVGVTATVSPPVAAITVAGLVPGVVGNTQVNAPPATIAIAAPVPTIEVPVIVAAAVAQLLVAGIPPDKVYAFLPTYPSPFKAGGITGQPDPFKPGAASGSPSPFGPGGPGGSPNPFRPNQ